MHNESRPASKYFHAVTAMTVIAVIIRLLLPYAIVNAIIVAHYTLCHAHLAPLHHQKKWDAVALCTALQDQALKTVTSGFSHCCMLSSQLSASLPRRESCNRSQTSCGVPCKCKM